VTSQRPLPTQDNTTYKHNRQTSMPRAVFNPAIPATERPQAYALDRAATGKLVKWRNRIQLVKRVDKHIGKGHGEEVPRCRTSGKGMERAKRHQNVRKTLADTQFMTINGGTYVPKDSQTAPPSYTLSSRANCRG
jgi:hypothetical protein